jgi:hypothetical protein
MGENDEIAWKNDKDKNAMDRALILAERLARREVREGGERGDRGVFRAIFPILPFRMRGVLLVVFVPLLPLSNG